MQKSKPSWLKETNQKDHSKVFNYQSSEWEKFSRKYKIKNGRCKECLLKGKYIPSVVTDHIISIKQGGAVYDERNLQGLCRLCDNKKRSDESKGIIPEYTGEFGYRIPLV